MLKKLVLFNCNLNFHSSLSNRLANRFVANSALNLNHIDVVQKVRGCSETEAISILVTYEELQKLPPNVLHQRLELLQEVGLADVKETNCLSLAKHHSVTLKNRVMSMQECGFQQNKITSTNVKKFLSLTHLQIHTLKDLLLIEKNTDVYKHLLGHAQMLEYYEPFCEANNIVTIKIQLLKLFLKHEIGITDERLNENPDILKRLKNKSIRVIKKNIDIAKNVIGLSSSRICRHPFILWADPDNTLKVIEEIKEIAGVDIKLCMSVLPKIIVASYENIKQIIQCLEEFQFSKEAVQRAICLFTLSSKTIRKRLNELKKEEYFSVCKQHPRALMLVYYYSKVKHRLQILKELNVTNTTLNTVSTSDRNRFQRYYEHGCLRQPSLDIIKYICAEFDCSNLEIRHKIRGFPLWRYASTIEIARNLNLLKERGFTKEEIFNCVHILFYNKEKIIEELDSLDKKEGLDCCKDNGEIKREFILPLVIYFIEKNCYFASHALCTPAEEDHETHSDIVIPDFNKNVIT